MAELLYGHVYLWDRFAGILRQEPGDRCSFTYDAEYLRQPEALSISLPPQMRPHHYPGKLHPYFDNLLAEGRQALMQSRLLGLAAQDRFARLLAFGSDCIGAVTIQDPRPRRPSGEDPQNEEEISALANRASISGVQAKLLAVKDHEGFRPARRGELSTHIAKLPSGNLKEVIALEHLTTLAAAELLPDDRTAHTEIASVHGVEGSCLLIRRFDREVSEDGTTHKIHFEEFNQILGHLSEDKYDGDYAAMAHMLRDHPFCAPLDVDRLFRRILVSVLLGNNDAHLKNFGMVYRGNRLELAPFYDVLAAALYPEYSRTGMALRLGPGSNPVDLAGINERHLLALAKSFGLKKAALTEAARKLAGRFERAQQVVQNSSHGSPSLKDQLTDYMRRRWNGSFQPMLASTGKRS